MSQMLFTHAALRLWQDDKDQWVAYNLLLKMRYSITSEVTATLVAFINGSSKEDAYGTIHRHLNLPQNEFRKICKELKTLDLLVEADNKSHVFASEIMKAWGKHNWIESADYYLATFDYPFVVEGEDDTYIIKDSSRMEGYLEAEPDLNRSKEYLSSSYDIPTINASEALKTLNKPFCSLFASSKHPSQVTGDNIKTICAVAFGKLRERPSADPRKSNIVRKTSPSGGSRHPTEGYIILIEKLNDLPNGIYHYSLSKNALERINNIPSQRELEEITPGVFRAPFKPKVIFVLTSLFERNMYRYREARTFRTIFIDIGHVASTIKLVSIGLGLNYFGHSYLIEDEVEDLLNLNKFTEGAVYTVAIS